MSANSSISVLINILRIFLLLTTCMSSEQKIIMNITDRLPSNKPSLLLHCKSKDNDLGFHTLDLNQVYGWSFNMNIWSSTLFWCNFW
ncbi:hypothetical protein DCAR_0314005 [Daucus carota subsp. sativus]|uniref:S-protein homolog n=1 Tax=Daucus carota subsp. sativus TaxID=79200 RepID=A0AAF1ATG0_DAUCS|nr:hypothetical protein DCAR_0314005 [Daucus carota subsp. sativus]